MYSGQEAGRFLRRSEAQKSNVICMKRKRTVMKAFIDGLWNFSEQLSCKIGKKTAYIFLWTHILIWTVPVVLLCCAITQVCGLNFEKSMEITVVVTGYVGFFGGFTGGILYVMRNH